MCSFLFDCREVQCSWNAKLGPAASVVPAEKIMPLFNDLQIFPTNAQGRVKLHFFFSVYIHITRSWAYGELTSYISS